MEGMNGTKPLVRLETRELVEERMVSYGPPVVNHDRTAMLWRAYISAKYGIEVPLDAEDVCWLNVQQKISREMHGANHDGPVDVKGYAENVELVREERRRRS